jgi:V/A-type H+-transporting ATPase subunit E
MAEKTSSSAGATSSGVATLIARLRDQGVEAGREQAARIVSDAERKAEKTVSAAKEKAKQIVEEAHDEAERLKTGGEDALRVATRDTILRFQEELKDYLDANVRRLVSEQMADRELLAKLILEVVSRATGDAGVDEAEKIEILVPEDVLDLEELRQNPKELKGPLSQLAKGIAGSTWREGVTFRAQQKSARGITVRVNQGDLEVDLSAEAVADILLSHLQPRFRALMQGIIQ